MAEFKRPKTNEDLAANFEQLKPYMNPTMAYYESSRCLFCYDAPCIQACPTGIDIPLFIRQIHTENLNGAAKTIYDSNYFGNICGKVCPTEELCEGACVYNHQNVKPIEIGRLQSFATQKAVSENKKLYTLNPENGKKIAIIGAGPAGISAACELRLLGYSVDIFEAKSQPSGLALYGCAPYKVTNEDVLNEIEYLKNQFSFNLHLNSPISNPSTFENDYDAILLGIGLGNTRNLNLEGENLDGVIGATESIEKVKLDSLNIEIPKKVVIVGGGNTAMDAASESARLGAESVTLVYRRSKEEMGAYEFEYDLAKGVGVKGIFNSSPSKILGENKVEGIRCVKTDSSTGKVEIIPNSEFLIDCDLVILATGQEKQTNFLSKIANLNFDTKGRIEVNSETFQTTNPKYFAAGDAVNGGAEVVNAAAEGKKAARGIHNTLSI